MMSDGFCGLHGRYVKGTVPGCPQCIIANAAGQLPAQAAGAVAHYTEHRSPDLLMALLAERDRYRDALFRIKAAFDAADDSVELLNDVENIVTSALPSVTDAPAATREKSEAGR